MEADFPWKELRTLIIKGEGKVEEPHTAKPGKRMQGANNDAPAAHYQYKGQGHIKIDCPYMNCEFVEFSGWTGLKRGPEIRTILVEVG